MDKIILTEKAYIAVTNIKRLGTAFNALAGLISVWVIDEAELKKIVGQISTWQADLFKVIETIGEEEEADVFCEEDVRNLIEKMKIWKEKERKGE